jgi:hypothetical protein
VYEGKEKHKFPCFLVSKNRRQSPTGRKTRNTHSGNYGGRRGNWLMHKKFPWKISNTRRGIRYVPPRGRVSAYEYALSYEI